MPIISLNSPPEDPLIDAILTAVRTGPPAGTTGPWTSATAWAANVEKCPAGHWLMPEGSRLYRYDSPGSVQPPAAVCYLEKDSTPYVATDSQLWFVYPVLDVLIPLDLTTLEVQQTRWALQHVLCSDLKKSDNSTSRAVERLSVAPSGTAPGCSVKAIREVTCEAVKVDKERHSQFTLRFTALCEGLYSV